MPKVAPDGEAKWTRMFKLLPAVFVGRSTTVLGAVAYFAKLFDFTFNGQAGGRSLR